MNNETERTLHELKLPGMASCWNSLEETHQLDKLTLCEGRQIMLQYERDTRGNNRIRRLIKNARFRLKASMEELETYTARGGKLPVKCVLQNKRISPDSVRLVQICLRIGTKLHQIISIRN